MSVPDPTPEEIAERCLEVQAGWDAATEERRKVQKDSSWQVPRGVSEVAEPQGDET
jgi:hypothetical protein